MSFLLRYESEQTDRLIELLGTAGAQWKCEWVIPSENQVRPSIHSSYWAFARLSVESWNGRRPRPHFPWPRGDPNARPGTSFSPRLLPVHFTTTTRKFIVDSPEGDCVPHQQNYEWLFSHLADVSPIFNPNIIGPTYCMMQNFDVSVVNKLQQLCCSFSVS